jgi:hypothetical protein
LADKGRLALLEHIPGRLLYKADLYTIRLLAEDPVYRRRVAIELRQRYEPLYTIAYRSEHRRRRGGSFAMGKTVGVDALANTTLPQPKGVVYDYSAQRRYDRGQRLGIIDRFVLAAMVRIRAEDRERTDNPALEVILL